MLHLFEQLGLTTGRKTKTGFSTDADVLAELAVELVVDVLFTDEGDDGPTEHLIWKWRPVDEGEVA